MGNNSLSLDGRSVNVDTIATIASLDQLRAWLEWQTPRDPAAVRFRGIAGIGHSLALAISCVLRKEAMCIERPCFC
jgi:hypothetical protein